MRIVHLSTYDLYGGAALAATRLHRSLRAAGEDSRMLVRQRRSNEQEITQLPGRWMKLWLRAQRRIDRLPLMFSGKSGAGFSIGWTRDVVSRATQALSPDIVHLHWGADGFVQLESLLRIRSPVVWTMHDMWAFTGGCHYAGTCNRFEAECGCCPLLGSEKEGDLSRTGWKRRQQVFEQKRIRFVAPSYWMAQQMRRSSLLGTAETAVIPNGIDTVRFAPRERRTARAELNLPSDNLIVLAGAANFRSNPRKGYAHLVSALRTLRKTVPDNIFDVALFGDKGRMESEVEGFRIHDLGLLDGTTSLARAYAAADVFVAPSLDDNLPNTVIEAMAMGLPVVAYRVGGLPEIVDHETNGLLAGEGDSQALGEAILRLVHAPEFRTSCGRNAREKILRVYSAERSAESHRALYRDMAKTK